jgi:hypothetical protein
MRFARVRLTIRLLIASTILGLWLYPIIAEERERRAEEVLRSLANYHASKMVGWIACSRYTRCMYVDRSGNKRPLVSVLFSSKDLWCQFCFPGKQN